MVYRWYWRAAYGGGLLCVGCGASTGQHPGAGGSNATSGVGPPFDAYVTATCSMARACCQKAGNPTAPLDDCESEVARQRHYDDLDQAGHVVAVEPANTNCLAAYRDVTSSCVVTPAFESACTSVFQGTLSEGAACEGAEECQLGTAGVACASLKADGSTRSCHALPLIDVDSPCWTDTENPRINTTAPDGMLAGHCGTGHYCKKPSSSTGTCAVLSAAGGPCDAPEACAAGLYCDTSAPTPACQPAKHEGESCGTPTDAPCAYPFKCRSNVCAAPAVATDKLCSGDYD